MSKEQPKSLAEFLAIKIEAYRKIPLPENNVCLTDFVYQCIGEWFKLEFAFYERPENSIGILAFLDREIKAIEGAKEGWYVFYSKTLKESAPTLQITVDGQTIEVTPQQLRKLKDKEIIHFCTHHCKNYHLCEGKTWVDIESILSAKEQKA